MTTRRAVDEVPVGDVFDSLVDHDGELDPDRLAARARTEVLDCGILLDSQILLADSDELPPAPFDEFPRLSAMPPEVRNMALISAMRSLILHELDVPVTIPSLPDVPPRGAPAVVTLARMLSTGIGRLRADDNSGRSTAEYTVRVMSTGDGPPAALMAASIVDPTSDHFGLVYLRIGPLERAVDQARRFVAANGPTTVTTWRRTDDSWELTAERFGTEEDTAAAMISSIR